ncbi:MAG: hypothetical protein AB1744_00860 [Candidatus Zixiibacteriota bacterium]
MALPLFLEVYGVRFRVERLARIAPELIARLFAPFVRADLPDDAAVVPVEFCPMSRATDIVTFLTPHLSRSGFFALHAGSLILHDQAVLLIGTSGTGKSSCVRRWVDLGLGTAGDDLVLISDTAPPRVMPYLTALQEPAINPNTEKGLYFPDLALVHPADIGGLAFLAFGEGRRSVVESLTPPEALPALCAQFLWAIEAEPLLRQRSVVQRLLSLPCWRLKLGTDVLENPLILKSLWSQLTGRA